MAIRGSEPAPGLIVPHLVVIDVDDAVQFYQRAFDAKELYRSPSPTGVGWHVHLRIWNSMVWLSTEEPNVRAKKVEFSMLASPETLGGSTCVFQVYVPDADEAFRRAVDVGGAPALPPIDMFWGDRYSLSRDPFGYVWAICTVREVLDRGEIQDRLALLVQKEKQ
jgi:PhnB protein